MTSAVATRPTDPNAVNRDASAIEILERVIVTGDLAALAPQERVALYVRTCESLGLNPLTRPFEYITLNSKLTLYVRKDATDQLRRIYGVSIDNLRSERDADLGLITVTADGHTPDGRRDQSTGVVNIKGLSGEALANGVMKAETKAKRRLTLSLVGLGFLDESEIEGAEKVDVDPQTGEVRQPPAKPASLLDAVQTQQQRLGQTTSTGAATGATSEGDGSLPDGAPISPAAVSSPSGTAAGLTPEQVAIQGEVIGDTAAGLTWQQFRSRMARSNSTTGKVKAAAAELWPDRALSPLPSEWALDSADWAALANHLSI